MCCSSLEASRHNVDSSETSSVAGTFCGVFRRQALDRGAVFIGCNKVVTGRCFLHIYLFIYLRLHCTWLKFVILKLLPNRVLVFCCKKPVDLWWYLLLFVVGHNADDIAETVIMNGIAFTCFPFRVFIKYLCKQHTKREIEIDEMTVVIGSVQGPKW